MKSQLNWNDAQNSEVTPSQILRKTQRSLNAKLTSLWQHAIAYLNASSEPRVWQSQNDGKAAWNAYDPTTKRSIKQVSMQELRTWLEERHYQNV